MNLDTATVSPIVQHKQKEERAFVYSFCCQKKKKKVLLSNVAEVRVNLKPAFTQWIKELLKTSRSLGQWQWGRACGN